MNQLKHAKPIGILFLAAFPAFGIGQYLLGSDATLEKIVGASLIAINSMIVLAIGLLLSRTISNLHKAIGKFYLAGRLAESLLLFLMVFVSFDTIPYLSNEVLYQCAMLILGVVSIPMCWIFWKNSTLPSWISLWGVIGYTLFAIGFVLELMGLPLSMYFLVVGGFWELFFGIWLISKARES